MSKSELKIMTWNIADGLSDESRALPIAEVIADHEPDIIVLQEGLKEGAEIDKDALSILENHVGAITKISYEDSDDRLDRHELVAISKPEYGEPNIVRGMGRNALHFCFDETELLGMHGLDRHATWLNMHELARLSQIRKYLEHMRTNDEMTSIVAGDMNDIHKGTRVAKLLRAARWGADLLPSREPGLPAVNLESVKDLAPYVHAKVGRLGSLSQRLASYAEGLVTDELDTMGFEDLDPEHTPTMSKGPLKVQLDRVMVRNAKGASEVVDGNDLSDHSPVVATIER